MSVCPSARPPVSKKELGCHWRDFHEIYSTWYVSQPVVCNFIVVTVLCKHRPRWDIKLDISEKAWEVMNWIPFSHDNVQRVDAVKSFRNEHAVSI